MIIEQSDPQAHHFILQPNRSLTWSEARVLLTLFAALVLLLGLAFAYIGLTLVLPFSGLDVLLLLGVFYYCQQQNSRREVVTVDAAHVTIERGRLRAETRTQLPRPWTQVQTTDPLAGEDSVDHVWLRVHGKQHEVGAFLCASERWALAKKLRRAIAGNATGS